MGNIKFGTDGWRGLIADDTIDTVVLHKNTGSTGYKITKFEIPTGNPFLIQFDNNLKILIILRCPILF